MNELTLLKHFFLKLFRFKKAAKKKKKKKMPHCATMLIYANNMTTAQLISFFSPKDAYLILRQLQHRRVKIFVRF